MRPCGLGHSARASDMITGHLWPMSPDPPKIDIFDTYFIIFESQPQIRACMSDEYGLQKGTWATRGDRVPGRAALRSSDTGNDKVDPPQRGFSDECMNYFPSRQIFFLASVNDKVLLVIRISKFSCGLRHSTPPDSLRPLLEVLWKSGDASRMDPCGISQWALLQYNACIIHVFPTFGTSPDF